MKKKILIAAVFICLILTGCSANSSSNTAGNSSDGCETRELFAMDTYMTLKAYGEDTAEALDAAVEKIQYDDELLSTGNENSEIYALNKNGSGVLSDTSAYLFQRSLEINSMTEGAFNPLIYPLMKEWGFTDDNFRVPTDEEINNLLLLTDLSLVDYDEDTGSISFEKEGMAIDFGGIAKGYTSSEVIEILRENGIESAVISLGGNVQTLGLKPDGSQWKVGIVDPWDTEECMGYLSIGEKAVITSGPYERYFEEDGIRYHHIMDPATGKPAQSGLESVTIISSDGTLADGLSTSLFVKGLEYAEEFWKEHSDEFDAVFMTEDKEVYITEGIEDAFSSNYSITVIRK